MYSQRQPVVASVEAIFPFGVFVRLKDGTRAYIRRRELSLSGDLDPRDVVSKGQKIEAVVTELADTGRIMELSVRATLPDPWQEFARQFQAGDVVAATVKGLFPDRVFAQILPGISGLIPLAELATWKVGRPEDVVWVGDRVEAVITHLDVVSKRVKLSVRQRLEQLAQIESIMKHMRQKTSVPAISDIVSEESTALEAEEQVELGLATPILVVEDDDEVREPLVKWLSSKGCSAQGVRTATDAMRLCHKQKQVLLIVDLDMPEVDGKNFIEQLRNADLTMPVAVMSDPELLAEHSPALQALGVSAAFAKPLDLDEILHFLARFSRGETSILSIGTSRDIVLEVQPFRRLAGVMHSNQPLMARFQQGLEQLVNEMRAEVGIVFHLNPASQKVSVLAHTGDVPLNMEAVYALVDSPVKDIIQERGMTWENRVSPEHTNQFRKLLDLLPFESCVGVPIHAGGQTEHALFLFHRNPDAFSHYRLRDALATAALFAVAVEKQALDERVQSLSRIFLSGQVAAAFSHEVYNKLSGLDLQFRNLRSDFDRLARDHAGLGEPFDFQQVQRASDKAIETAVDLKRTVEGFRRLMETKEEQAVVEVNQVVRQAEAQARPLARRAKVDMRLELAPDLLPATGSSIGLYQVFLNLMLNAIQQMENKPGDWRVLTVTTLHQTKDGDHFVQVRFTDSGRGIHRQLWEQIFALGFTTRPGGSGLGLFIARSLIESMGGRIAVEESLVPLGTTFLVELLAVGR